VLLACMRGVVDVASMDSLAAWEELGRSLGEVNCYTKRLHACIGGLWRGLFTVQYNNDVSLGIYLTFNKQYSASERNH
jgi:hypothetical protein